MKVVATDAYQKLQVTDKGLNRIPEEGEIFDVTVERFKVLNGKNNYKTVFAKEYVEEPRSKKNKKDEITI